MIPLLLALWFTPQEKPPEKATLSGTVVNSVTREPLARATVLAEPGPGSPAASTTTDDKGRFELVALEPGQYHLKARRNGYQETYYGARRVDSKGTAISLEPAQHAKDLEIKLLPYAVVSGTVRAMPTESRSQARRFHCCPWYTTKASGRSTLRTAKRRTTWDSIAPSSRRAGIMSTPTPETTPTRMNRWTIRPEEPDRPNAWCRCITPESRTRPRRVC